jgi:hypothetical protein
VHEYSKLFNHLVQFAPEQVDNDEKKNDHFMNRLLTKLLEHLALSMGGTFPDFVSNTQGKQEEEGRGNFLLESL